MINPFDELENKLNIIEHRLQKIEGLLEIISLKELPKPPERKFYSVKEAAKRLNVSAITIYRGIEQGSIPAKRIGIRAMIPSSYTDK